QPLPVKLLIREVGKVHDAAINHISPAGIFVHGRSDVESLWRDVLSLSVRRTPHEHISSAFGRASLEPVHILTCERRFGERDRRPNDEVGRDSRFPRSIWFYRFGHKVMLREIA